ncbi:MAG TPA: energy transducer TonB [Candidatus Eisenbacteria bacterium]|jgi:TonB family protein
MRRFLLAAIAALATLAAAGAAAAADLNAGIEHRILRADSVRVARIREPVSGESGVAGDDRLDDFIVERPGSADPAWKAAMAELLARAMRRYPEPAVCRREPRPRQVLFGLQFFTGDLRTSFIVYLSDRCIEFWTARVFEGSTEMHDFSPRFLALLKQVFPSDTTVRHLDLSGTISCEDYHREHPEAAVVEQLPEATRRVPPAYPRAAKKAKIEGEVVLEAMVGADGAVGEVRVSKSVPELDAAAIASVLEWRFAPALDCRGQPVACRIVIPVQFTLSR